jgi:tetratricopeptide (TPR) repeat protein
LVLEERFSEAFGKAVDELGVRLTKRGDRDPGTIEALHRVGVIAHLAGDQATAVDVFAAALAAKRSVLAADDPSIVETLIYRGRALRYGNERERARNDYDEAARRLALVPNASAELKAQLLQAEADWQRSVDLPQAIASYRAALALRRASRAKPDFATVDNLTWLAWTLNRAGRRDEAQSLAIEARAQLVRLGLTAHSLRGTLDNLLAEKLAIDGRLTDAEPLLTTAAATAEAARHKQLGGYARRGFPLDGYEPLALEALSRGRYDEAWTLLERARAPSHVDFTTLAGWSRRDPVSWHAWRRIRDALQEAKRRSLEGTSHGALWTSSTAPLLVSALRLHARAYDLERRFLDRFRPRTPSLAAVRALLGPNDALVGWLDVNFGGDPSPNTVPQRSRAWGYVLRKDRPIAWVSLWETRTPEEFRNLAKDTGAVFESLRRAASWRRRVDPDPEIPMQMRAWSKLMVDPLLPYLKGVDHVISERLLEPLELAVLPDGRMLGEEFDLSYVPSALTYGLLAELGEHPSGPPAILAVSGRSDPPSARVASLVDMDETSRSQRQLRNAYRRNESPLDRLPRLRYAALEAETVSSTFPRHLVLRDSSTAAGALDDMADRGTLGSFSVIHIAAHTLTDNAPEHCALAIGTGADRPDTGNGLVEVEDILLGWDLDADLMTLSGCETLRAAGAARGEPYGFTPALFASGARRVLSSIWTVDDRHHDPHGPVLQGSHGGFAGSRLGYRHAPMPAAHALREAKTYVRTLADAKGATPSSIPPTGRGSTGRTSS